MKPSFQRSEFQGNGGFHHPLEFFPVFRLYESMRKSRLHIGLDPFPPRQKPVRVCDHTDCESEGEYRAPKSPTNLRDYYWFCLTHVREYNKAWDFYRNMPPEEIERSRISAITWDRPSWPMGWHKLNLNFTFAADLEDVRPQPKKLPPELKEALRELNLPFPTTWEEVKKQYKTLVKDHHPDKHGGSKEAEDKLKKINQAYAAMKKFFK